MIRVIKIVSPFALLLALIVACSTEKNTLLSRSYHGMTAHYNGYFNASELIRTSMDTYRGSAIEDYYEILPIELIPDDEEVIGMYPAIDTAITKCTKVITNHSMPSNERPARKKDEHNRWIDENWTMIGIASYYRRDYEGAMKNFEFVRKFYSNDPTLYVGELWMAKTNIATGEYTKAKFNLDNLDKAIQEEEDRKKTKSKSPKKKKSKYSKKKKKKKDDKPAKFPKKIRFDFEKTKAELALITGNTKEAITYLEESLKFAKKSKEKTRVHFILGQLFEREGQFSEAQAHYAKVLKGNSPYEMNFNARLKKAFLGNGEKTKKSLMKMLKDAKNAEFKDQIYYALAGMEMREGNETKAIEYYHSSAFYSVKNTRQKGMAYETLADMQFAKRNYVPAQKYYDSCAAVIEDSYPNAEGIRNKAKNLADLVVAVETANYEDSVQSIASLSETDRNKFLKKYIKGVKEEIQRKKERDAERLRELQQNENLFVQNGSGSKWYWNNARSRSDGYDEFKKLWGTRENEDDWRRSDKIVIATFNELDSLDEDTEEVVEVDDTLTVEYLTSKLPLSDDEMALSNERLLEAHYNAGLIYKEQLNEEKIAQTEFEAVLNKKIENEHNLLSAYQLYQIFNGSNSSMANQQKDYILNNYPNSDYANYLRDPNYFIKKKERDKLAEQEYVRVLDRYNKGLYYPVISKANIVIYNEKDNVYRSKFMLLKAMSTGQIKEDKQLLVPILDTLILEYPGTSEAARAQELLDIIKSGYSENIDAEFGDKYPFIYNDRAEYMVIVFLDKKQSSNAAKSKIVDFQREYFSRKKLKVSSKLYNADQSMIMIRTFDTEAEAGEYIRVYKKTRKYLLDLQKAKILMISKDNLKILIQKQNLEMYENYYEEYY